MEFYFFLLQTDPSFFKTEPSFFSIMFIFYNPLDTYQFKALSKMNCAGLNSYLKGLF